MGEGDRGRTVDHDRNIAPHGYLDFGIARPDHTCLLVIYELSSVLCLYQAKRTIHNMHQIETGHPKDHTQSGDISIPQMPRCRIQRAHEREDGGYEQLGAGECHCQAVKVM